MTVHFHNVGREKHTWSCEVATLSDRSLIQAIKKQKALKSQGIDFGWNDEGTAGSVYVGGFRKVGSFRVEGGARL